MKSLVIIFIVMSVVSSSHEVQSQTIDTLVDVGKYKLHFNIMRGSGVPILFESGGGNEGKVWKDLIAILHKKINATFIIYDRAGMATSGIDTAHTDILNEISGLEIALKKLGYTKEIFLVAHSFGGTYATLFSARNSHKVKGAVLIDIPLPCFLTPQRVKEALQPYKEKLPPIKVQAIGTYYLLTNYEASINILRKTPFPANIPAILIGSDHPPYTGKDSIQWKACQQAFGKLPLHSYVLAVKSSHYVYVDDPALVSQEIIKLYKKI